MKPTYQSKNATKHGMYGTPIHRTWQRMKGRCQNENDRNYKYYGARGITVCDRWQNFKNFYEDMGDKPTPKHSIDRIDNNLGYSPENCRWATMIEQGGNRRDNVMVTFRGKTKHISEWARELGIVPESMRKRLKKWPLERALTEVKGAIND